MVLVGGGPFPHQFYCRGNGDELQDGSGTWSHADAGRTLSIRRVHAPCPSSGCRGPILPVWLLRATPQHRLVRRGYGFLRRRRTSVHAGARLDFYRLSCLRAVHAMGWLRDAPCDQGARGRRNWCSGLTIVGGDRERLVVTRRGLGKTVCARGA